LPSISRVKVALLALFLCWAQAALAEVAVPPLVGRVVDQTNTLSSADIDTLNQRIRSFEQRKGSQIAILIVPTTQPETIEQYSIRAAETWKIGRKKIDDGALLVIAKNDHKLRIEVGYGLEGALTDVNARRIIDEVIAPRFKEGDFSGGISAGLTRMIGVIDGEPLPKPAPEASHGSTDWAMFLLNPFNPFSIILVLAIAGISRSLLGRLAGSITTGGLITALVWFLLGSITVGVLVGGVISVLTFFADSISAANQAASRSARGSRRGNGGWSSGWSGGSSGGGWSGGSSSSSSDSGGGGGSFGGGGASGSW
jgi:uncharacterized protein